MPISPIIPVLAAAVVVGGVGANALMTAQSQKEFKRNQLAKKKRSSELPNPPIQLDGKKYVQQYLVKAEEVSKIQGGLATFGLAASLRESAWNNLAANKTPKEARAACKAWEYQKNKELKRSPFVSEPEYWCWGTGGWFGGMPAYMLARDPFQNLNPILAVHDPATSTAMFVGTIHRLVKDYFPNLPPEHRNWLSIRRSMASLATMYDYNETRERARDVRERLAENLEDIGVDPDFMYQKPIVKGYPGNQVVWDALKSIKPETA